MLDLVHAPAPLPASRPGSPEPAADDWLAVSEHDLREAHAEACALFAAAERNAAARLRHARSMVLLEQLLAARAVQRALGVCPQAARASLRGDHALGYLLGLAASQGDPTAAPASDRALSAALRHIHGLVFGMEEAHRLVDGAPIEVGAAFGDGALAADADLQALLTDGAAAMPAGLLAGLPWLRCCSGDPTARPH
ncbi:hypothetical protein [Roseomonas fluvialis]|uniref:Uncharacterized protein n=1 Tax=Roseomonas fluvialis TaxID=1750527 RepID=A0ABM7YB18_9PROT|nr:hypothetical protein [Roseomonas fluvialis]BDG75220.1 hypothetical protein Rmf_51490 [Roseomonas fluvialis]